MWRGRHGVRASQRSLHCFGVVVRRWLRRQGQSLFPRNGIDVQVPACRSLPHQKRITDTHPWQGKTGKKLPHTIFCLAPGMIVCPIGSQSDTEEIGVMTRLRPVLWQRQHGFPLIHGMGGPHERGLSTWHMPA